VKQDVNLPQRVILTWFTVDYIPNSTPQSSHSKFLHELFAMCQTIPLASENSRYKTTYPTYPTLHVAVAMSKVGVFAVLRQSVWLQS
jgi:hypothetical protein